MEGVFSIKYFYKVIKVIERNTSSQTWLWWVLCVSYYFLQK